VRSQSAPAPDLQPTAARPPAGRRTGHHGKASGDLDARREPRRVLVFALHEAGSFQLLLAELSKRM
jgi:hypothetical protein